MSTPKDRLRGEHTDLVQRRVRLEEFLARSTPGLTDLLQIHLLVKQAALMRDLELILASRIRIWVED